MLDDLQRDYFLQNNFSLRPLGRLSSPFKGEREGLFMINYSIVMRSVNANLFEINQAKSRIKAAKAAGQEPAAEDVALVATEKQNAFAVAQYADVMTIEKFARHIATHGCVYSRADISAILYMAVDCMREMLLDGKKIRLGDLGDFSINLSSKGAESAEKFSAQNITAAKVVWEPGSEFKNLMNDAEFNLVASRQAQAAVLKAVRAGETMVDLSKPVDDPEGGDDPQGGGSNPSSGNSGGGSTGGGTTPPADDGTPTITSIGGKLNGELITIAPGTTYPVNGTHLKELCSDNFWHTEDKQFIFNPVTDEIGTIMVNAANALGQNETTITVVFEDEPIFEIHARGK